MDRYFSERCRGKAAVHFDFNNRPYVVQIAPRALILHGQPCKAKIDRMRGIIWISDQVPTNERRRTLFHELRHLWLDGRKRATDDEADADQAAEMMDLLMEAYLGQGGDAVLEALTPTAETSSSRNSAGTGMMKCDPTCGYCNARILAGNVGTDKPAWNKDLSQWTVLRGGLCYICDRVTAWLEEATEDGLPLGRFIAHPPPRVLSGAEAGEWIAAHARECGAMVYE